MTKRSLFNSGNRDRNEQDILKLLRVRGVRVTLLRPGDGADLIVAINPMEYWEIKNPNQPEYAKRLTKSEEELKAYCHTVGIPYVVIETVDDANQRLNLYFDR